MPLEVILVEPEIPPNTGNVIRLCANTGAALHLVEPLGFSLDHARLRRAGLDYREWASVRVHADLPTCLQQIGSERVFALTTRGTTSVYATRFRAGDALLFGCETRGLDAQHLARVPEGCWLRLPLLPGNRSLNLSNAVAVTVYEAWRQLGFPDGS